MERHLTTTKRDSPGCLESAEKRPFRNLSRMMDFFELN